MSSSATLPILPTRKQPNREKVALQATAPLLTESLEALRLTERIERALDKTGYGSLRTIAVSVLARIVTLTGRVHNYHLKQVAQATALAVPGAHQVRNELDVVRLI